MTLSHKLEKHRHTEHINSGSVPFECQRAQPETEAAKVDFYYFDLSFSY